MKAVQNTSHNTLLYGRIHRFDFVYNTELIDKIENLMTHLLDRKWNKVSHFNAMIEHNH